MRRKALSVIALCIVIAACRESEEIATGETNASLTQEQIEQIDAAVAACKSSLGSSGTAGMSLTLPFDTPHTMTESYCGGISHYGTFTKYSVDFASVGAKNVPVLAAYEGIVEIPPSTDGVDCGKITSKLAGVTGPNSGWGNHVWIHHPNGCRSNYAHLDRIPVKTGDYIQQGGVVGIEGTTGCSTGVHLHFNVDCPDGAGGWVQVRPEPLSEYTGLDSKVNSVFQGGAYTHYPVGTLLQVARKPEIYLVISQNQVMHIPDWTTFVAHRLFYDSSYPTQRVLTVPQMTLDCYKTIEGNKIFMQSKLITCGSEIDLLFRDDANATRRKVPFALSDERYAPLIKSWGFAVNQSPNPTPASGTASECAAFKGADLKMRPGTIVEEASDNDFWVITADTYSADDVAQQASPTYPYRLRRSENGSPFMPLLYGTYGVVIQIPNGSTAGYTSNGQSGVAFDSTQASTCPMTMCPSSTMCVGGGGSTGAGTTTCTLGQRACADVDDFVACEADQITEQPTWHKWPCGSGWECVNADGMCTQKVSTCTAGQRICLSKDQFADCQVDTATGTNYWHPWLCGAGWECVSSNGQCTQTAYAGDAPHTIRCENHAYTYTMHVTGPIQNGIWSPVSGNKIYLEYGADTDGWASYLPSLSSKPYSLWVGDADGSGHPYTDNLEMRGNADKMNLFLYSPDSGQQGWFKLDGTWNVIGDCWLEGTSIRHRVLPPPSGTISCTQSGAVMKYAFDGPMQMLLVSGSVSGPTEIQYGSDSDGWAVPTTGKLSTPWNGTYHHEISLPAYVNNLNFFLNGSVGGRWFDLSDADYDGDRWAVGGACKMSGNLVTHANIAASKTIDCQVSGSTMTVTVVGDVTSGIFGTAPTANPIYLEYGSDTDGWGAYTTGKANVTWYSGTQLYTFSLSSTVQNLNFFLYAPSTGSQPNSWFDLSKWTATGACYKSGGSIRH